MQFEEMYDYILPYLPGAEPGIVDLHLRRTLRDFLKRTTVWRETFAFSTTPGVQTYELLPPDGAVASLLHVDIDGRHAAVLPEHLDSRTASTGRPTRWSSVLPQLIKLHLTPDAVYPVVVHAALTLPLDTTARAIPDGVFNEHAEGIAAGVISAMMLMPGKPWSQVQAGALYGRAYGSVVRDTRGKLRDGGQPNVSTFTAARRFGV